MSVTEREILEQHFIACTACRRDYDEYARTLEIVQALPRPQVSGDFATRVLAEARRREAAGGLRTGLIAHIFARPAAVAVAAALLVAAGVSAALFLHPVPGTSLPASQVAQGPVVPGPTATGDPDVPISVEPVSTSPGTLVASKAPAAAPQASAIPTASTRHGAASGGEAMAAVPDSLFDHTADVEFVLDPVKLRRERGRGYTPVPTSVRGEQASITF